MKKTFNISLSNNVTRVLVFDFSKSKSIIHHVENVCVIKVFKYSNHCYNLKFFAYRTLTIYCRDNFFTLKELYYVLQNLLQNNL